MDNVYAVPGDSFQQIGGECPAGWVVMLERRPTLDHVANASGEWVLRPPAIPETVTRFQARAALAEAGLLDQVNAYFDGLQAGSIDRLAWEEAPTVRRSSEVVAAAVAALGLTGEQVDALFIRAANFD